MEEGNRVFSSQDNESYDYRYNFTNSEKAKIVSLGQVTGTFRMTFFSGVVTDVVEQPVSLDNGSLVGNTSIQFTSTLTNTTIILDSDGLAKSVSPYANIELAFVPDSEITIFTTIPENYMPNTIATKEYVDAAIAAIVNGDEVSY